MIINNLIQLVKIFRKIAFIPFLLLACAENTSDGYIEQAILHTDSLQYDKAVDLLNKAIELDSTDALAYYYRGKFRMENYEMNSIPPDSFYFVNNNKSLSDVKKAIRFCQSDTLMPYILVLNAQLKYNILDLISAYAYLNLAITQTNNPELLAEAYSLRAYIFECWEDYNDALNDYDKAIILFQNSNKLHFLYFNRHFVYKNMNNLAAAIADLSKAIELSTDTFCLHTYYGERAMLEWDLNRLESALKDFDKAVELGPSYPCYYSSRARIKYELGDIKGACKDWKTSLRLGNKYLQINIDSICVN